MRTALAIFPLFAANLLAQDLPLGVTYTCGAERLYLENCNIRDTSDTSTCMVAHPDRPQHNGFMNYTTETRSALKNLLPTCKQPSAAEFAKAQAVHKRRNDMQASNEKKASDEADAVEARAQAVGTGTKPQTPEEKTITRCIAQADCLPRARATLCWVPLVRCSRRFFQREMPSSPLLVPSWPECFRGQATGVSISLTGAF